MTMQILYLSHGGGPMPLLKDSAHQEMVTQLRKFSAELTRPSAILIISAHWEAAVPTITSSPRPPLIYDYYNFPEETYQIQYPCPGEPELARQVQEALVQAGIRAQLDDQRGLDHGVFVPMKLMYPAADIPCVQLSLVDTLDAGIHLAIGRALSELEYDNLLVIGSGFSFHNMKAFYTPETPDISSRNEAFQSWLEATCADPELDEQERSRRLEHWQQAPHARYCHPREEHLLPLHVCYGLAGRPCDQAVSARIMGKRAEMFCWNA